MVVSSNPKHKLIEWDKFLNVYMFVIRVGIK